jgi:2-polyprenyl-3-methyl-5-hydroxy-6-metoxy-1,4-benzoquinol methylase
MEDIPKNLSGYYTDDYYSFKEVSKRKLLETSWRSALRRTGVRLGTSGGLSARLLRRFFSFPPHHDWFRRAALTPESAILDVGCGSGSLLVRIWKEGFTNVSGIDPYIKGDIRYDNGLEIRKARLEDLRGEGLYDFIMMNHSLEHIPDQQGVFSQLARLLKHGGTALVRVPVSTSYAWEHYRTDWVQLDSPRHLFIHSEKSMEILSRCSGLRVREVVYDSLEFQFNGSELCRQGVLIEEQKDFLKKHAMEQVKDLKKLSVELNRKGKGDMACFYIATA